MNVGRLRPLLPLSDIEFYRVAFLQASVSVPDDGRIVDEDICSSITA